eukprot:4370389-Pleurochrysis_carterae.AAC.1
MGTRRQATRLARGETGEGNSQLPSDLWYSCYVSAALSVLWVELDARREGGRGTGDADADAGGHGVGRGGHVAAGRGRGVGGGGGTALQEAMAAAAASAAAAAAIAAAQLPVPRAHHAAVAFDGGMLLHGGWSDRGDEAMELHNGVRSDTHLLRPSIDGLGTSHEVSRYSGADNGGGDGEGGGGGRGEGVTATSALCWNWVSPMTSGSAPRRAHHTATLLDERARLLVCGGWDGFARVSALNVLCLADWRWSAVRSCGAVPAGISDHAVGRMRDGSVLLVGRPAAARELTGTHRWTVRLEACEVEGGGGGGGGAGGGGGG